MKKFEYSEIKVKLSPGKEQSTISTNFGLFRPVTSDYSGVPSIETQKSINELLNQNLNNKMKSLLGDYTCFLEKHCNFIFLDKPNLIDKFIEGRK